MAISPEEIYALWGHSGIAHADSEDVENVDIPEDAKRLLVEIGLPREAELCVRFAVDEGARRLQKCAHSTNRTHPHSATEFVRIGTDDGTQICLALGSGAVFAIDPSGKLPWRFVNSSLSRFLESMRVFHEYREVVQSLAEEEIAALIARVAMEMRGVDPGAFDHPENWWSVIVEQMRRPALTAPWTTESGEKTKFLPEELAQGTPMMHRAVRVPLLCSGRH